MENFKTANWLMTRTIEETIDEEVIFFLINKIYDLKEKVDYFQIFDLIPDEKNSTLKIIHRQESDELTGVKEFKKEYIIKNIKNFDFQEHDDKIFCICDGPHQTFVFPAER
ncbi:MAG: DUF960 family protein [Cetobacterium sp.]